MQCFQSKLLAESRFPFNTQRAGGGGGREESRFFFFSLSVFQSREVHEITAMAKCWREKLSDVHVICSLRSASVGPPRGPEVRFFESNTRQHRRIFRGCASVLNAGRAGSRPHEAWVHSFSKPLTGIPIKFGCNNWNPNQICMQ